MKIILFDLQSPFESAEVVEPQDVINIHGNIDAKDILDGTHPRYRAQYAGVFLSKLKDLHERLSEEVSE